MAETVRQFTSSPASKLLLALGSFLTAKSSAGWTIAALVRYEAGTTLGEGGIIFGVVNEAGASQFSPILTVNGGSPLMMGANVESAEFKLPKNEWALIIGTKEKGSGEFGSAKPRLHLLNIAKGTWLHGTGNEFAEEGQENKWHHNVIGGKWGSVGPFLGRIAAIAVWKSSFSDKQCEELGALSTIGKWAAFSPAPVGLWELGQQSVSEQVLDLVDSANQTSREETSVVAEVPPIPYGAAGKFVKMLIGGVVKECRRWVLVGSNLISR